MKFQLKKLPVQTVVVTGAASATGLATAREAAQRGANVVLGARDGEALAHLVDELTQNGRRATYAVIDAANMDDVQRLADKAVERFGGFDTWVNNAEATGLGRNGVVSPEDRRAVFDAGFWSVVHGSLVAVERFKRHGGALINVGIDGSKASLALAGVHAAAQCAVRAFTDLLRTDLEEEGAPVSVMLIESTVPEADMARYAANRGGIGSKPPSRSLAPGLVAEAVVLAAENLKRDLGAAGNLFSSAAHSSPRLMDRYMDRYVFAPPQSKNAMAADRGNDRRPGASEASGKQTGAGYARGPVSFKTTGTTRIPAGIAALLGFGAGVVFGALRKSRRAVHK